MPNNSRMTDNSILREGLRRLRERLPAGWRAESVPPGRGEPGAKACFRVTGPDRTVARVAVRCRTGLSPRAVVSLLAERRDGVDLLLAPYLSAGVRERLRAAGTAYLDLTGNAFLSLSQPGLFLETSGADVNPERAGRGGRTLRGATAGRIVRALIDTRKPPGVRELAARTGSNPGYVSRLLAWLDSEALVERRGRGQLVSVDWQRLLRRWAEAASLDSRGSQTACLAPRGLGDLVQRLRRQRGRYAVTGSLAAAALAPIAPPRLAVLYLDRPEEALGALDLRPAESGANVLLIEPADEGVYSGASPREGVSHVAPSQAAADLLASPGRGPAEAEALIAWMAAHEDAWRG